MKLVKNLMVVALPLMLVAGCATQESLDKANQDSARISTKAAASAALTAKYAEMAADAAQKAANAAEQAARAAERASAEARAAGDKADRIFRKGLRK